MEAGKFGPYTHAAVHLQNGLHVLKNNLPLNRKAGHAGQANLENQQIKSFQLALNKLREAASLKKEESILKKEVV